MQTHSITIPLQKVQELVREYAKTISMVDSSLLHWTLENTGEGANPILACVTLSNHTSTEVRIPYKDD
jgi:hypothetical protein